MALKFRISIYDEVPPWVTVISESFTETDILVIFFSVKSYL